VAFPSLLCQYAARLLKGRTPHAENGTLLSHMSGEELISAQWILIPSVHTLSQRFLIVAVFGRGPRSLSPPPKQPRSLIIASGSKTPWKRNGDRSRSEASRHSMKCLPAAAISPSESDNYSISQSNCCGQEPQSLTTIACCCDIASHISGGTHQPSLPCMRRNQ